MKQFIKIFDSADALAKHLANQIKNTALDAAREKRLLSIALSGGSTPVKLFKILAESPFHKTVCWENLQLFWGDERCVPPDHGESNFAAAKSALLDHVSIPAENIHRIRGENEPAEEVARYSEEIRQHVPASGGFPCFDWIFLGLGGDGHTASLFPGTAALNDFKNICSVGVNPVSGQKRITLTFPVLNAAKRVTFLVTGENKSEMVASILREKPGAEQFPTARVKPNFGVLEWYLDKNAAAGL